MGRKERTGRRGRRMIFLRKIMGKEKKVGDGVKDQGIL